MSQIQANTVKGTRDFNAEEVGKRTYIVNVIKNVFECYGFMPLETPAMENLETLLGKYGDEGDRLIFKILNSGEYLEKAQKANSEILHTTSKELTKYISEKALRYDLTVPFARYVVQHRNDITFPFKRYQIQPVWRADRPQKGRYREFYQCDADVIGSNSLMNEAELVLIMNEVFQQLGIKATILINNRKILESKILQGMADNPDNEKIFNSVTVGLDKYDKIGKDGVLEELKRNSIPENVIKNIEDLIDLSGSNDEKLSALKARFSDKDLTGVKEIDEIFGYLKDANINNIEFTPTLARGLNYYTATIFEVKADGEQSVSVSGGGRYDDLTGIFGMNDISGVGFSFGLDRIYNVMEEGGLFPETVTATTKVLFANFDAGLEQQVFAFVQQVRHAGIPAEIYPDNSKLARQMKYANAKNIPFVVIAGSEEISSGTLTLKSMETGTQEKVTIEELIDTLKD